MARVVMFVDNDVTIDSRVRREASSLVQAGHAVTVVGRQTVDTDLPRENLDGWAVIRVPFPDDWESAGVAALPGRLARAAGSARAGVPHVLRSARRPHRTGGRTRQTRSAAVAGMGMALLPAGLGAAVRERVGFRRHLRRIRGALQRIGLRRHVWRVRRVLGRGRNAPAPAPRATAGPARATAGPARPAVAATASPTRPAARANVARAPAARARVPPAPAARRTPPRKPVKAARTLYNSTWMWLRHWRYGRLPWARAAAAAAPPADIWHGHDLSGLPAAIDAQRRHGGQVVYDSHELFLESTTHANQPRWARFLISIFEGRWARRAAAVVAVNDAIGGELTRRYGVRRIVVVDNCPPRWTPPAAPTDRLRELTGVPPDAPLALYHGRFALHRGIEQLADALLEPGLEHVHAAFLGYGWAQRFVQQRMPDPRYGGRLHLVPAVPPGELLDLIATADLEVMAIQPSTLNHRLATGNKLFEALAVGVPVVASDHPGKRLVLGGIGDGPLGELCDPTDVRDVARAMRAILSLSPEERTALRERCRRAASERWNWEVESAKLVALYDELAGGLPLATV